MLQKEYLEKLFSSFGETLSALGAPVPAVTQFSHGEGAPYRVLVSTILSLRTRDQVTLEASERLFAIAPDVQSLSVLDEETIAEAIKPAGFYTRKASQLKKISAILLSQYNGRVPSSLEELLALPGVGLKTANLVLGVAYGVDAICVDCHVHQIANRLGWVETSTPEETEGKLREILPKQYWIQINDLFVKYGQNVCLPISPKCSLCPAAGQCPKTGVEKSR